MIARGLNAAGLERFRAFLAAARGGSPAAAPRELLQDDARTLPLPVDIGLDERPFLDRLSLGAYLCDVLARLPPAEPERNIGLWAWLSLLWFDQLCPPRGDGTRRPGLEYRHVPESGYRYRFRHLLYGPYQVYRRHGSAAGVLLSGPLHVGSGLYREISDRRDLITNRGVVEAVSLLYWDPRTRGPKRGCQSARAGTVRRLVRVLQQLDVTYDVYGMSGVEILRILPAEFDQWRPQLVRAARTEPTRKPEAAAPRLPAP